MKRILTGLIKNYQQRKQTEQNKKFYEVRYEWIKFFEQREQALNGVQLPAFMLADQQMKIIMANNELDFYYKKIQNYKKRKAVA